MAGWWCSDLLFKIISALEFDILADLAGDVVLGPRAGVVAAVQNTLTGATHREDAARQVQLHQQPACP